MDEYINRERYLTECRDNAARGRIRERSLTRAERDYRKRRTVFLLCVALWGVCIVATLLSCTPKSVGVETEEPVTAQVIPELVVEAEDGRIPGDDVEAVSAEFDPVREDIPMDAELQRLLYQACGETGIRYELALAVIWKETDFRNIRGDGGDSIGYMQVQPRWHSKRMERLGVSDLSDPYGNFLVGCDFLFELLEKYELTDALTAYNSGRPGNSQYAKDVLNYMNILTMEEI